MPLSERQRIVLETIAARDRAEATLQSLLAAQAECAAGASPRADPFREVTGKSAMENAIAQTRRMIESLNTALAQAQRDLAAEPALAHAGDR